MRAAGKAAAAVTQDQKQSLPQPAQQCNFCEALLFQAVPCSPAGSSSSTLLLLGLTGAALCWPCHTPKCCHQCLLQLGVQPCKEGSSLLFASCLLCVCVVLLPAVLLLLCSLLLVVFRIYICISVIIILYTYNFLLAQKEIWANSNFI